MAHTPGCAKRDSSGFLCNVRSPTEPFLREAAEKVGVKIWFGKDTFGSSGYIALYQLPIGGDLQKFWDAYKDALPKTVDDAGVI